MSERRYFDTETTFYAKDYSNAEDFLKLWSDLFDQYNYRAEYNLIDDEKYGPELLDSPEDINDQHLIYDVSYVQKQYEDHDGLSWAEGGNDINVGAVISNPSAQIYSGRLCVSFNLTRQGTFGHIQKMRDSEFRFLDNIYLASITDIRLYWNSEGRAAHGVATLQTDYESSKYITQAGRRVEGTTFISTYPTSAIGSGGNSTGCNDLQLRELGFIYNINIPIFLTHSDAEEYVITGDLSKSLNNPDNSEITDWFIRNEISKETTSGLKDYKKYGYMWNIGNKKIVLYKSKKASGSYNLVLKSNAEAIQQKEWNWELEKWSDEYHEVPDYPNYRYLTGNADPYIGRLITNIPIVDSEEEADDILNGKKRKKKPGSYNPTGNDLSRTPLNGASFNNLFSSYYICNIDEFRNIAAWLMDPDNATLIKDSPQLWGDNPISMIIDTYWSPLDIRGLLGVSPTTCVFGYVDSEVACYRANEVVSHPVTLFETIIQGSYNDWRDYQFLHFSLMLPYYGIVPLETSIVLNKSIKVVYKYYAPSKTIKYWLYVDDVITAMYETASGCSFPISSLDFVGKANEKWESLREAGSEAVQMGGALVSAGMHGVALAGSISAGVVPEAISSGVALAGDIGNIVNIGADIVETYRKANKDPKIMITGSTAVDASSNDCPIAYLIIEEDLHILPDNLNEVYNYPSYIIDKIGNYKGLVMAQDIILNSDLTSTENSELIQLLQSGIII